VTIQVEIQQEVNKTNWNPDLDGNSKKSCVHNGRVKNDYHPQPNIIQECQSSLYPESTDSRVVLVYGVEKKKRIRLSLFTGR